MLLELLAFSFFSLLTYLVEFYSKFRKRNNFAPSRSPIFRTGDLHRVDELQVAAVGGRTRRIADTCAPLPLAVARFGLRRDVRAEQSGPAVAEDVQPNVLHVERERVRPAEGVPVISCCCVAAGS